tara:strand:- start:101 stop:793 length:693 start_codon:yes stop_codon:yes gene_type:complete
MENININNNNNNNNQNGITSISQLPPANVQNQTIPQMSNMNNQQANNIVLTKNEIISESNNQMPSQMPQQVQQQQGETQQTNYNELIGQLQKANSQGMTGLPSRDIPAIPMQVNNDVEIKPNFVPPPPTHEDYINNMQTPEHLIQENVNQQRQIDNLDMMYNELQIPIILSILYFAFQLPAFKKFVKKMGPGLFANDGNANLYGNVFISMLFSTIFYLLLQLINRVTQSL